MAEMKNWKDDDDDADYDRSGQALAGRERMGAIISRFDQRSSRFTQGLTQSLTYVHM